jgi:predicted O-linked N-acetylglucosamine transferase (SPINDLY family)
MAAVPGWRDVREADDRQAAARIAADDLDVLVDLKGHTQGARLGILAPRPAPRQIHYLGYPGTIAYAAIDAIVADAVVAPPGDDAAFAERVLRLPRCYQVNDAARPLPAPMPRAALGLPEDAVVLACFNQPYKLSPRFFAAWMDALTAAPAAVLWIYAPGGTLQRNLRAAAARAAVDPARLVFADALPQAGHVARLRAADLALDVLPVGSHTTGSDALWAGVPLLTCRGDTFAGRVGASLVAAAGMPELVTESPDAYTAALRSLAADRDRLRHYKAHLDERRHELPLFDTAGFARDWEALLERAAGRGA